MSSERVRDAYRVLSGEAVAKPVKSGARASGCFCIGLGAAAVAAVAAYRKQQADDPLDDAVQRQLPAAGNGR